MRTAGVATQAMTIFRNFPDDIEAGDNHFMCQRFTRFFCLFNQKHIKKLCEEFSLEVIKLSFGFLA